MKRITINITEELESVLRDMASNAKFGPLVEALLRESPRLESARKRLKVKFVARTEPGKRAKKQEGDK